MRLDGSYLKPEVEMLLCHGSGKRGCRKALLAPESWREIGVSATLRSAITGSYDRGGMVEEATGSGDIIGTRPDGLMRVSGSA